METGDRAAEMASVRFDLLSESLRKSSVLLAGFNGKPWKVGSVHAFTAWEG